MNPNELRHALRHEGYAVIPRVMDDDEVRVLRDLSQRELERAKSDTLFGKAFLAIPKLAAIPFSPGVISALRATLGEHFLMVPEFALQTGRSGAWHFDASSFRDANWLLDPDYLQVQCGIYLQDAHPDYAGGLGVIPRSHRQLGASRGYGSLPARLSRKLNTCFGNKKAVPTRAGDLLIFDFRLLHRGLPPHVTPVPEKYRKFAIFFGAISTSKHAHFYMQNMKDRGHRGDPFYQDIANLRFPDSYPRELIEHCRTNHIEIASF